MQHLNLETSVERVMTELQNILIKLVDTEIIQMKPKLSVFIVD